MLLAVPAIVIPTTSVGAADSCGTNFRAGNSCNPITNGQIRDRQVAITGTASGNATNSSPGGSGSGVGQPGSTTRSITRPGLIRTQFPVLIESNLSEGGCVIFAGTRYAPTDCVETVIRNPGSSNTIPGDPAGSGIRRITLEDIAHFTPVNPVARMEPNGWAVAKLHTNFFSSSRIHDRAGTLFGLPTTVRFIPIEYHWTYGEGGRANLRVPGNTWASLGLNEFAETPTSYRYQQLGNYTITHQVVFRAEYRFNGGGWTRIDGVIVLPANNLYISVGNAETLLFHNDCTENPAALGCGS